MIFVTADSCRSQLEGLAQRLVSALPGSTIYQHTDLCHVLRDVLNNHVDAVFLEAEMDKTEGLDFVQMLRRQKSDLPVFIIANPYYPYSSSLDNKEINNMVNFYFN